ncbi:aorsin [Stipitochalara longipes BDJ]|nr:aorsin [Stipitochalara longipes BDJ]
MRRSIFLGLFLALASTAQTAALPQFHVVHEKRDLASSTQWVKREKLAPTTNFPLRIGLTQSNLHRGHDSHPDSENYGKHWTSDEVIEAFAPEQKTINAVTEWLAATGIGPEQVSLTQNKAWLAFNVTVEEAENLLHTEYHLYEHISLGHTTLACEIYHVPKHIQKHIDYITPGIKLFALEKRGRNLKRGLAKADYSLTATAEGFPATAAGELSTCDEYITPACIRALYEVPEVPDYATTGPRADNSMGIFEEADFFSPDDLDLFFANFTPRIPNGTQPTPAFIDGAEMPPFVWAGGESNLDFELAYPLIYPQTITLYQTDDQHYADETFPGTGLFNTFLDAIDGSYCTYSAFGEAGDDPNLDPKYPDMLDPEGFSGHTMCGVFNATRVISISYGGQEADLPAYYQQRQCNEFMKLGLQGHSIFFASGDAGVGVCLAQDKCLGLNRTIFSPAWPNTCPYVTNVGATKLYPNQSVTDPESAAGDPIGDPWFEAYSSGGGFSNIYPRPDYQGHLVDKYLRDHTPPYPYYEAKGDSNFGKNGGLYNRLGRAYPDVAANGDNIAFYLNGDFQKAAGTSASTPIFASLINRINELRLNAGKSAVGFINPAIYSHPEMFNDITNGTNPGCCTAGFSTAPGWDPVTGLGKSTCETGRKISYTESIRNS